MKRFLSSMLTIIYILLLMTFNVYADVQITNIDSGWYWPTSSNIKTITSEFGRVRSFDSNKVHQAIDIAGSEGSVVYATRTGDVVETFGSCKGSHEYGECSCSGGQYYGNYVVIYHGMWNGNRIYSMYMHLKSVSVNTGTSVKDRQEIGKIGNTGPSQGAHLHFQISKGSKNPDHYNMTQLESNYINTNPAKSMFTNGIFSHNRIGTSSYPNSKYGSIIYIMDGVNLSTTHTCPTTPKNNKGQWNFQTKGSKIGACKECGKEFDWFSKIQSITNKKATLKSSKKSYKVTLYKKPYEDAGKAASGKVIKELPVTGTVKNAYGTDWYEVEYQKNKKGYITKTTLEKNYDIGSVSDKSAKKTSTQQESAKSTLKINLTQYPSQHTQGNNFGLRGTVTSNYKITSVKGTVVDSKGKTQLSSSDKPNATSMDIKTAALNNNLSFNKLPVGKYTLKIVAVDSSGKKVEDSKTFTVKAKANQLNSSQREKTVTGVVKIPSSWDNLSIRKGPSTSYKIVGSMKNGAKCTVYPDKTKNGWYYVRYNGVEGYAAGNRINLQ